ncbi:MAG: AAA family ATPase [Terracidiphilus sp.]
MRIDQLTLRNFNGFEDCSIDFDPHFTLLVGDNGAGKTSVLDAISILLDSWILGIKGDEEGGGISPGYVRLKEIVKGDSRRFEPQLSCALTAKGSILNQPVNWTRERAKMEGRTRYVDAKHVSKLARETGERVANGENLTLPLLASYGTERRWLENSHRTKRSAGEMKKGRPSRLDGYLDCNLFCLQETATLGWLTNHYNDRTSSWQILEKAFRVCIEGMTAISYSNVHEDFIAEIHGERILFRNLSDGYKVMLMLIGDLVRRIDYLNKLQLGEEMLQQTPGIVLIDEIDLHLHPNWQRRILHDLKRTFPAIQFFATTHSPQVIGEAQPQEIRVLDGWKAFPVTHAFGLDSSRVLEEIQGASRRSRFVEEEIHGIAVAIDKGQLGDARRLIADLESKIGPDDPEAIRPRRTIQLAETPVCEE